VDGNNQSGTTNRAFINYGPCAGESEKGAGYKFPMHYKECSQNFKFISFLKFQHTNFK